jgi:hypothetical protein
MAEKETIFSSKVKYKGIFSFKDFYKFCYEWLTQETGLVISEDKYSEKITGDSKDISVVWSGGKNMTDYFKFEAKIGMEIKGMTKVELEQKGVKTQTNKGEIEIKISGVLSKDYQGKFETNAYKKFMRAIYERWVIPSNILEYQGKIAGACDEFLSQAKEYLDLEGKK